MTNPGTLEVVQVAQGARYALLGRTLHGGDVVALCCSGGWLTGRYEWAGRFEEAPRFYFSIELEGGAIAQQSIELPEGALLRWPES